LPWHCLNCTEFVKSTVRKIIKIVATRCCILKLKCTKFDFGWGSASDPAGELTAFSQTLLYLRGLLLREVRNGRERRATKGGGRDLLLMQGGGEGKGEKVAY